jgi:ATP-binding cassette subfamily F protein 3
MIAGELGHDAGTIRIGSGVQVGYYAQHHADTLDMTATAYEVVQRANPSAPVSRVRAILGAFMFSGDDVDKPVKVLSGGERARVALARLLANPGSLLLMDEPTNHLDLESSESLARSLTTFDGTLVFVSHNRSLIRTLATRIWNVEHGSVETYPGTLDEYMYSCAQRASVIAAAPAAAAAPARPQSREDDKARKRREAEARNKRSKVLGPLEKQVTQLEERIAELESAQSTRSVQLADPEVYADDARRRRLLGEFQDAQAKLEELTGRWEIAAAELEEARRGFPED